MLTDSTKDGAIVACKSWRGWYFFLKISLEINSINIHVNVIFYRLRSCEAACELLEKYNMSYQSESNWMDELDSKLRNLEELEAARAKEAWEKHVVSTPFWYSTALCSKTWKDDCAIFERSIH